MKKLLALTLALVMIFALAACGAQVQPEPAKPSGSWAMIPAVMVDGVLYITTSYNGMYRTDTARPEFWDGEITSVVPGSEMPTENDQSNYAPVGSGYRFGAREGTVEVLVGRYWKIYATEAARQAMEDERRAQLNADCHSLTLISDYAPVRPLRESYFTGNEIHIKLPTVTEQYYVLTVNGELQEQTYSDLKYTYFMFFMPDADAVVEIKSVSVDIPAAPAA